LKFHAQFPSKSEGFLSADENPLGKCALRFSFEIIHPRPIGLGLLQKLAVFQPIGLFWTFMVGSFLATRFRWFYELANISLTVNANARRERLTTLPTGLFSFPERQAALQRRR
jgi:hypothetical protein